MGCHCPASTGVLGTTISVLSVGEQASYLIYAEVLNFDDVNPKRHRAYLPLRFQSRLRIQLPVPNLWR